MMLSFVTGRGRPAPSPQRARPPPDGDGSRGQRRHALRLAATSSASRTTRLRGIEHVGLVGEPVKIWTHDIPFRARMTQAQEVPSRAARPARAAQNARDA